MKPLIGISCGSMCTNKSADFTFSPTPSHYLSEAYTNAVERAGGIPVILPSFQDPKLMEEIASKLDGIILSGGPDIDPSFFGQRAIHELGTVDVKRDAAEVALARFVIDHTDLPLLGICRGIQMLNVAEGGTLFQDLRRAGKEEHALNVFPRNYPSHDVDVKEGSRLYGILKKASIRTNSFHHQAVMDPAPGYLVTALSSGDQVIEAIEKEGSRFIVGVQWHPECMYDSEDAQKLLRAFISASERK